MPILLKGSCHCGLVRFTMESKTPVPYQLCACSICRKVGGVGGSINLGADNSSLRIIQGKEHIKVYQAVLDRDTPDQKHASSERSFCGNCSSMLWLWDHHWPELIHPFASAIDEPELKQPEEMYCIMQSSKPSYVRWPQGKKQVFDTYGEESIEEWHKKNGEFVE
ncbi:hypothetical protein YB2330_000153 [Saitoella coloradoensis]